MSELWQTVIVAAVVVVAAILLIRALRKPGGGCDCGCGDCPLSEKCSKKDK